MEKAKGKFERKKENIKTERGGKTNENMDKNKQGKETDREKKE